MPSPYLCIVESWKQRLGGALLIIATTQTHAEGRVLAIYACAQHAHATYFISNSWNHTYNSYFIPR